MESIETLASDIDYANSPFDYNLVTDTCTKCWISGPFYNNKWTTVYMICNDTGATMSFKTLCEACAPPLTGRIYHRITRFNGGVQLFSTNSLILYRDCFKSHPTEMLTKL